MIGRILVKASGGMWKLKGRCISTRPGYLKRYYIGVYNYHQDLNGSAIAWDSDIKGVPCFPHGMKGIFISGSATIGKNCVIFQHVTIGSNTLIDSKGIGSPKIGDCCYIGAGAKIIGGVNIGDNVRIGANSVVHKDIPDNSVVVSGREEAVVKKDRMNNRFYSYRGRWVFFDDGEWMAESDPGVIEKLDSALRPGLSGDDGSMG